MSAESKSSHVWSKVCGTTIHVLRTVTQVVRRDRYPTARHFMACKSAWKDSGILLCRTESNPDVLVADRLRRPS